MLKKSTALREALLGKKINRFTNPDFSSNNDEWLHGSNTRWEIDTANNLVKFGKTTDDTNYNGRSYKDFRVNEGVYTFAFDYKLASGSMDITVVVTAKDDINNPSLTKVLHTETLTVGSTKKTFKDSFNIASDYKYVTVDITTGINNVSSDITEISNVYFYQENTTIRGLFSGGMIEIYTGTQPNSADDAPVGTKLVTIVGTDGLTFEEVANGQLAKKSSDTWSGTAIAAGTAGWFRLKPCWDDDVSNNIPRIDGAVSTAGAELNMGSTAVSSGSLQTITSFTITIPE